MAYVHKNYFNFFIKNSNYCLIFIILYMYIYIYIYMQPPNQGKRTEMTGMMMMMMTLKKEMMMMEGGTAQNQTVYIQSQRKECVSAGGHLWGPAWSLPWEV